MELRQEELQIKHMTRNCYLESTLVIATRSLRYVRIAYLGQVSVKHMAQWASRDLHAYLPCDEDWVKGKACEVSEGITHEVIRHRSIARHSVRPGRPGI